MLYGKLNEDKSITYVSTDKVAVDGKIIFCPSDDVLAKAGIYPVVTVQKEGKNRLYRGKIEHYIGEPVVIKERYEDLVSVFIREKYTMDAELAILRQRDTKAEEFAEYFAYCEDCKARAKAELNEE